MNGPLLAAVEHLPIQDGDILILHYPAQYNTQADMLHIRNTVESIEHRIRATGRTVAVVALPEGFGLTRVPTGDTEDVKRHDRTRKNLRG